MIRVISGLRDDLKIWKLLQQITREPCSLAVSHNSIEAPKRGRIAKGTSEYLHVGAAAQSANSGRAFIGAVDIIKYCDLHTVLPAMSWSTISSRQDVALGQNGPQLIIRPCPVVCPPNDMHAAALGH